jgi:hypothetical protein
MLERRVQLIFLFALTIPSLCYGQTPATPSLSGNWQLNLEKSKLPKSLKIGEESLTIKQDDARVEFFNNVDGEQFVKTYVTDKKDKIIREIPQAGSQIVAKAYWKGTTLVTETRADFKMSSPLGGTTMMQTRDSWTLSGDGLVLMDKFSYEDTAGLKVYDKLR